MRKTESVKRNHIFACYTQDPHNLNLQEFGGAEVVTQQIVKRNWINKDWCPIRVCPEQLQHPGMKEIKHKELYDKWRPLIPVDKRKECKHY